jgi:hypothetical protein
MSGIDLRITAPASSAASSRKGEAQVVFSTLPVIWSLQAVCMAPTIEYLPNTITFCWCPMLACQLQHAQEHRPKQFADPRGYASYQI